MLRRRIVQTFKLRGLRVRLDGVELLEQVLAETDDPTGALATVVDSIKEQRLDHTVVTPATINQALASLTGDAGGDAAADAGPALESGFQVVDIHAVPKFRFSVHHKSFLPDADAMGVRGKFASVEAKLAGLRERYYLVLERTLRCQAFAQPGAASGTGTEAPMQALTPVERLLTTTGSCCILGLFTRLPNGALCIEDLTGAVPVDVSCSVPQSGLFTDNSFVVAHGEFNDGVFVISELSLPPVEHRDKSRRAIGGVDFFGGLPAQDRSRVREAEREAEPDLIIMLSDVWLDRPVVLDKLRVLFEGYESIIPTAFVLMGNFTSRPLTQEDVFQFSDHMAVLADLIAEFPNLAAHSHFVLVPGPSDPGANKVLPRSPLPDVFCDRLRKKVRQLTLATNPCRLRSYTKEIVVFREDLMAKMRRHCLITPSSETTVDLCDQLVKTILANAHLSPLPQTVRPVYWQHDQALRVFPTPHTLVLADKCDQYQRQSAGCTTLNPGSFPADFSFVAYTAQRDLQFCRIPGE